MRPISSGMLDKLLVRIDRIVSREQLPSYKKQFNQNYSINILFLTWKYINEGSIYVKICT